MASLPITPADKLFFTLRFENEIMGVILLHLLIFIHQNVFCPPVHVPI